MDKVVDQNLADDQPVEETEDTLHVNENRPIFNSLIDNKESSRYIIDMMK